MQHHPLDGFDWWLSLAKPDLALEPMGAILQPLRCAAKHKTVKLRGAGDGLRVVGFRLR